MHADGEAKQFNLYIRHDWDSQVARIRDATTDDTNLMRYGNGFYRICRNSADEFQIHVFASVANAPVVNLWLNERALYVTHINGRPFETYARTLDLLRPQAMSLDGAVMDLHKAVGTKLFELQSMLVFCVAESLRNDHMACRIARLIGMKTTGMLGVDTRLPLRDMLLEAHAWGQTSDAILNSISPVSREGVLKQRNLLTAAQKSQWERAPIDKISNHSLREFARTLKVIKRP